MKKKRLIVLFLFVASLEAGCSAWDSIRGCPDGQIEWMDLLMINDIKYSSDFNHPDDYPLPEIGESIGKVKYMLADHACANHELRNGDASYVPRGKEVFEAKGYKSEFRVITDGRVFEVIDNPNAETLGDFADIQGKVSKISIRSDNDDSLLGELDRKQTDEFLKEYLSLVYRGDIGVGDERKRHDQVIIFFHLEDGSTFHTIYVLDENILGDVANGNEKTKRIIEAVLEK